MRTIQLSTDLTVNERPTVLVPSCTGMLMPVKKAARVPIVLECTICRARNYPTEKNIRAHPARLVLNKYCPTCRRVTEHREVR